MENNKNFNKLSVVSLILILVGPLFIILDKLHIYLPKGDFWEIYLVIISFILGFIFAIISLYKIKQSAEKGRILSIATITIFIILSLLISYALLFSQSDPIKPNSRMKSQLASVRAQAESYYQSSNYSYDGLCEATQDKNGLGGNSNSGLLMAISAASAKNTTKCFSGSSSWVVTSGLVDITKPYTHYCTDMTGVFEPITKAQNDSITNADTLCPQQ
ncbi:MAG: hypothetical protein WCI91_00345 [Candidatus Nomurabacteria bacterium]